MTNMTTQTTARLRQFPFLGHHVRIHADSSDTQGRFAVLEFLARPGSEPPLHIHENEDEFFFVIEGQMRITLNGEDRVLGPGQAALVPRGVPHTFKVLTPEMRSMNVFSPGGFEEFFRAMAGASMPPPAEFAATAARYGSRFVR